MDNNEKLKFKVGLSGTYWDRLPEFSIWVDDQQLVKGVAGSETQYYEFDVSLEEKPHKLLIRLENKSDSDVVQDENKQIIKDMLLNIHDIEIDDISLTHLLWNITKFVGDDPSRPVITGCVNMGWNGAFTLEFYSPFYQWLLENL